MTLEPAMSYRQASDFLARYTQLVELTNDEGARVAICPEWSGRVMTSTCGGMGGPSFGFINRPFIEAGTHDPRFNNYGGEERFWLSPEGGPFSLWFKPGVEQTLENWYTPPALNEGAWEVTSQPHDPECVMAAKMQFCNASATEFELDVARAVRLTQHDDFRRWFGDKAADVLGKRGVKTVGYETVNQVTNRGPAMTEHRGLVSIWILGMFNPGPETVVIVPYRPGDQSQLGPVVKSDYFGEVPSQRLRVTPEAVLFRADGAYRSKIGTSQQRARNVLGAIDYRASVMTIVRFNMPANPAECRYMNNMWEVPQADPYTGDVANSYNDGAPEPGTAAMGAFYEIESLSPAVALRTHQSLVHRHRTVHVQADAGALASLADAVFGVDLTVVRREMVAS